MFEQYHSIITKVNLRITHIIMPINVYHIYKSNVIFLKKKILLQIPNNILTSFPPAYNTNLIIHLLTNRL